MAFLVALGVHLPLCAQPGQPVRTVSITFDDLPATHGDLSDMRAINKSLLEALKRHRVPATGFVNEGKLFVEGEIAERTSLLRAWLDANHDLGNHTFSHIAIDRASVGQYKEDVVRGEIVTSRLLRNRGQRLRFFRHTQLRTGPTARYKEELDAFLAGRGYAIAAVTIDNDEYIFADVYARARSRNDAAVIREVGAAYVPYMERVFAHFEALSRDVLGYEVKQILLLHANRLNADYLDDLIAMMRRRGYRFITLEEALTDPAYRLPAAQSARGLSWIHRWALAKGLPMKPEPGVAPRVRELFDAYRRD